MKPSKELVQGSLKEVDQNIFMGGYRSGEKAYILKNEPEKMKNLKLRLPKTPPDFQNGFKKGWNAARWQDWNSKLGKGLGFLGMTDWGFNKENVNESKDYYESIKRQIAVAKKKGDIEAVVYYLQALGMSAVKSFEEFKGSWAYEMWKEKNAHNIEKMKKHLQTWSWAENTMKKTELKKIVNEVVKTLDEMWIGWEEGKDTETEEINSGISKDPIFNVLQRIKVLANWGHSHAGVAREEEFDKVFTEINKYVDVLIKHENDSQKGQLKEDLSLATSDPTLGVLQRLQTYAHWAAQNNGKVPKEDLDKVLGHIKGEVDDLLTYHKTRINQTKK
jgi:hypothetical protein